MLTKYSFWGNLYRHHGYIIAIVMFLDMLGRSIQSDNNLLINKNLIFICFCIITWGLIFLWLRPIVKIEKNGVLVVRFGIIKRKVAWDNIEIKKKTRSITRYGMIGLDPRYLIVTIKDGVIADKYLIVLPFFDNYDAFVQEIEKNKR